MDELSCPGCGSETFTELGWLGGSYWLRCRLCGMEFLVINEYGQPLRLPTEDEESAMTKPTAPLGSITNPVERYSDEHKVGMYTYEPTGATAVTDSDRKQLATLAICTKKMYEAFSRLLDNHPFNVTLHSYVVDASDNLAIVKHNVHVIDDVLNDPSIIY